MLSVGSVSAADGENAAESIDSGNVNEIMSLAITGLPYRLVAGQVPPGNESVSVTPPENVVVQTVSWTPGDAIFAANVTYTVSVLLSPVNAGFNRSLAATVNGYPATLTFYENGTVLVEYTYPETSIYTGIQVFGPGQMSVGTTDYAMVVISYQNGVWIPDARVNWSIIAGTDVIGLDKGLYSPNEVTLSALKKGTAKVRVTSQDDPTLSTEFTITVIDPVISSVSGSYGVYSSNQLTLATTGDVHASVFDQFRLLLPNERIVWSVDNSSVISFSQTETTSGEDIILTPKSTGTVTIRAASASRPEIYWEKTITVTPYNRISVNLSEIYVVDGDKNRISIRGTAEGNPVHLRIYIFGPNEFVTDTISVADDGTYEYNLDVDSSQAANQYDIVIEHPMDNNVIDVYTTKNMGDTNTGFSGDASGEADRIFLWTLVDMQNPSGIQQASFIVWGNGKLQGSTAADALTQMIGEADIDDIYVRLTLTKREIPIPAPAASDSGGPDDGEQLLEEAGIPTPTSTERLTVVTQTIVPLTATPTEVTNKLTEVTITQSATMLPVSPTPTQASVPIAGIIAGLGAGTLFVRRRN
jgi:hypothetical protein